MKTSTPDTERINLALTIPTIKALRMLAVLTGVTQNQVTEDLLIKGGLHAAVEAAWSADRSTTASAPPPVPQKPPAPPKPAPNRAGWMPEVPKSDQEPEPIKIPLSVKVQDKAAPARLAMMPDVLPKLVQTPLEPQERAPDDYDVPW